MNYPFPILIIEPNPLHHSLIEHGCKVNKFRTEPAFATTAEEAITYLESHSASKKHFPKLVFLELLLPEPAIGLQLLEAIRKRYPRLPVIVLSNHHKQAEVQQAYDLGANSFVIKPVTQHNWEKYFQIVLSYWMNVVTLAPAYLPDQTAP